jgi:hypothetical protein
MLQFTAGSFMEFAHAIYRRTKGARSSQSSSRSRATKASKQLAQAILSDSVSPAICMNDDCNFTCEMEPDQDAGYCEECRTNSIHSALILADLI